MKQNWKIKETDYHSYKIMDTTIYIGPRPDAGFSELLYDKIDFFISLTESWVEYSNEKPYLWFPWKETTTIFPDTVFFGILKTLNHLIHTLKIKNIYMHCDGGTHRAPSALGAFLYFYYYDKKEEIVSKVETPINTKYIVNNRLMTNPNDYFIEKMERDPNLKYIGEFILSNTEADLEGVLMGYRTILPDNLLTKKELKNRNNQRKIDDIYTKFRKILKLKGYTFNDEDKYEFIVSKDLTQFKAYLWGIPYEKPHGVLGLDLLKYPVLILLPQKYFKAFLAFNNRYKYHVEYYQSTALVYIIK